MGVAVAEMVGAVGVEEEDDEEEARGGRCCELISLSSWSPYEPNDLTILFWLLQFHKPELSV